MYRSVIWPIVLYYYITYSLYKINYISEKNFIIN